jgi:hypothetical protein
VSAISLAAATIVLVIGLLSELFIRAARGVEGGALPRRR